MKRYWAAFARSGSPGVSGQTPWPQAGDRHTVLTLNLRADRTSIAFAADHQCGFWARSTAQGTGPDRRTPITTGPLL